MTIHLLRHFKVLDDSDKKYFSSKEIDAWVEAYDEAPLDYHDIDLPEVESVYTSALLRAKRSADFLALSYESKALFNEVETKAFLTTSWRFPKLLWLVVGRSLWMLDLVTKSESKTEAHRRAKEAVDFILTQPKGSIMIVTHGFFMLLLAKELKLRGFKGKMDRHPKNAKLYTFSEKER